MQLLMGDEDLLVVAKRGQIAVDLPYFLTYLTLPLPRPSPFGVSARSI